MTDIECIGPVPAQAIFFTPGSIAPYNSFKYMGCMIVGITLTHFLTYFPMWCGSRLYALFLAPLLGLLLPCGACLLCL